MNHDQDFKKLFKPLDFPASILVEQTFDIAIGKAGGVRADSILGKSPSFLNADYLFPSHRVIAELKELKTDWPQLPEFQQKISDFWLRCLLAGRISEEHIHRRLPHPRDVRRDILHLFRKPLKRVLEKANRQIKETRTNLALKDHQGVVFVVADDLLSIQPIDLMALLTKILLHDYSEIKCLVLLTANEFVEIVGDDFARLLWAPSYSQDARDDLPAFINDLGKHWFSTLEATTGPYDSFSEVPEQDFLEYTKYISPPRRKNKIL